MRSFLVRWTLACILIASQTVTGALATLRVPAAPSWIPQGFNAGPPGYFACNFAENWYYQCPTLTNTRNSPETVGGADGTYSTCAALTVCISNGVGVNSWEARTNGIRNNTMVGAVAGSAVTPGIITGASRTASATAVLTEAATNGLAVGNLVTVSGCSVSAYNGNFAVSAVSANVSFSYVTANSTTDSATGCSYTAMSNGTLPNFLARGNDSQPALVVTATGSVQGINYVALRTAGQTGSGITTILQDSTTQIAASYGQTWASSAFLQLIAGSTTNLTAAALDISGRTSGGAANETTAVTSFFSGFIGPLARYSAIGTVTLSTTAFVDIVYAYNYNANTQVDYTVLYGWPQLENNSLINSTVASATVASGGSLYTPSSSGTVTWAGSGCSTNPVLNVTTNAGGAINAVTSVATAGSCTTFPPAGATTWTDGTGLGTGSGATFNLTPTNNAAQGFATPPILTSGSAQQRLADVITGPMAPTSTAVSMMFSGTPTAPAPTASNQDGLRVDGTTAFVIGRITTGAAALVGFSSGSSWTTGQFGKLATSIVNGAAPYVFNGSTVATPAPPFSGSLNRIVIGSNSVSSQWNGTIALIAVNPNTALPAGVLQGATRLSLNLNCPGPWYARRCKLPANDNEHGWRKVA